MSRWTAIAYLCLMPSVALTAEAWQKGYFVTNDGAAFSSEYSSQGNSIFVRSREKGDSFDRSDFKSIVSVDYAKRIRSADRWQAVKESLFYFDAASQYRWDPAGSDRNARKDRLTFWTKIGLLAFTGYTYHRAAESNQRLARSYAALNDSGARARFQADYRMFLATTGFTALYFSYTMYDAYASFDRDIEGNALGISESKIITVDEFLSLPTIKESRAFQAEWTIRY